MGGRTRYERIWCSVCQNIKFQLLQTETGTRWEPTSFGSVDKIGGGHWAEFPRSLYLNNSRHFPEFVWLIFLTTDNCLCRYLLLQDISLVLWIRTIFQNHETFVSGIPSSRSFLLSSGFLSEFCQRYCEQWVNVDFGMRSFRFRFS